MKRILCSLLAATLPFGSVLADAPKSRNAKPNLNSSKKQLIGVTQEIEKICALWCNALDVR